jgi:uncharacterized protein (DUF427 family)
VTLPAHARPHVEESPRWIRAHLGGETVVDSKRAKLVHPADRLPFFVFPEDDVRTDLLGADRLNRRDEGLEVRWDAVDEWLEEEEPLIGHARDPFHRIDVRETSRHVVVRIGDETVAETRRAKALFETGLPTRWYIPQEDVRTELLEESDTDTICAYKGHASYWSIGDEDDIVWTYREPLNDAVPVKGMLAFFNERVDLEVDGVPQERPRTQWSRRVASR